MNAIELRCARLRHRKSANEMAKAIGKSVNTYNLKECGKRTVTLTEACVLSNALGLSEDEFVTVFFDGIVPYRKVTEDSHLDSRDMAPHSDAEP